MVYLSRIYTKTGDDGSTALGDGQRRSKDDVRVTAYGEVDELNSALGVVLALVPGYGEATLLRAIQHDLFDLGADLCVPSPADAEPGPELRIVAEQVTQLERAIDRLNDRLAPLRSFVLPGGTPEAALLHLARTVCRRTERAVVTLSQRETVNPHVLEYLNRLSDLLFVMARSANATGSGDVLWQPGRNRQ